MKFSHLIEYNMRNTFLEKSYAKSGGKVIPRSFYKNTKLSIFLDQQFERFLHLYQKYIKNKVLITCFTLFEALSEK